MQNENDEKKRNGLLALDNDDDGGWGGMEKEGGIWRKQSLINR